MSGRQTHRTHYQSRFHSWRKVSCLSDFVFLCNVIGAHTPTHPGLTLGKGGFSFVDREWEDANDCSLVRQKRSWFLPCDFEDLEGLYFLQRSYNHIAKLVWASFSAVTKVWSPENSSMETSGRRPGPLRQERREIFFTLRCLSSGIHTSTAKACRGIPASLLWDKSCGCALSGGPTQTHHTLHTDTHVTHTRSHAGKPLPYSEKKVPTRCFFSF